MKKKQKMNKRKRIATIISAIVAVIMLLLTFSPVNKWIHDARTSEWYTPQNRGAWGPTGDLASSTIDFSWLIIILYIIAITGVTAIVYSLLMAKLEEE